MEEETGRVERPGGPPEIRFPARSPRRAPTPDEGIDGPAEVGSDSTLVNTPTRSSTSTASTPAAATTSRPSWRRPRSRRPRGRRWALEGRGTTIAIRSGSGTAETEERLGPIAGTRATTSPRPAGASSSPATLTPPSSRHCSPSSTSAPAGGRAVPAVRGRGGYRVGAANESVRSFLGRRRVLPSMPADPRACRIT